MSRSGHQQRRPPHRSANRPAVRPGVRAGRRVPPRPRSNRRAITALAGACLLLVTLVHGLIAPTTPARAFGFGGSPDTPLTPTHREIMERAGRVPPPQGDPPLRSRLQREVFREHFIRAHSASITAAADYYRVPPGLVGAELAHEASGKFVWMKQLVYAGRRLGIISGDPRLTSIKPSSVQVGRAAEILGYDSETMTTAQMDAVSSFLSDARTAPWASAGYLRRMADLLGYCEDGAQWSPQIIRDVAATYRNGPGDDLLGLTSMMEMRKFVQRAHVGLSGGGYITPAIDGEYGYLQTGIAQRILDRPPIVPNPQPGPVPVP